MGYAERVFAFQHRTAIFQLFVNGRFFRVLRWDRSGVIASRATNYVNTVDDTSTLLRVLFNLSRLNRAQRGFDPSAHLLHPSSCGWRHMSLVAQVYKDDVEDPKERRIADMNFPRLPFPSARPPQTCMFGHRHLHSDPRETCLNVHDHDLSRLAAYILPSFSFIREMFRMSISDPAVRRYMLVVEDRKFLVGKPFYETSGLIGRGTRGYLALDWDSQRFMVLKDTWRPFYEKTESEGEILRRLNKNNVPNVPTLVVCEDLPCQDTETSQYAPDIGRKHVTPPFKKRQFPGMDVPIERRKPTIIERMKGHPNSRFLPPAVLSDPGPAFPDAGSPAPYRLNRPSSSSTKRTFNQMTADVQHIQGSSLRHLQHHRLVIAEVCLPSTAFAHGKQWVSIVFDCILGKYRFRRIVLATRCELTKSPSSRRCRAAMRYRSPRYQCRKYSHLPPSRIHGWSSRGDQVERSP